jgi:hypothetical protein
MTQTALTFRTARVLIETGIRDELLLAYGRRLPTIATTDALAVFRSAPLADDDLCFVSTAQRTYRFRRADTTVPDGDGAVAPFDLPSGSPGRWLKTDSQVENGYLERCELFNEDADQETINERLYGKKPSLLISFDGAKHRSVSNRAGALYWYIASYRLLVISTNMRGGETAWYGSARRDEAALDPGTAAMLGDVKQTLAGSDLGLDGAVERVELGDERPVIVALAKRTVIEELDITVWASVRREDDDLVPLEGADAHHELAADDGTVAFGDESQVDFDT